MKLLYLYTRGRVDTSSHASNIPAARQLRLNTSAHLDAISCSASATASRFLPQKRFFFLSHTTPFLYSMYTHLREIFLYLLRARRKKKEKKEIKFFSLFALFFNSKVLTRCDDIQSYLRAQQKTFRHSFEGKKKIYV